MTKNQKPLHLQLSISDLSCAALAARARTNFWRTLERWRIRPCNFLWRSTFVVLSLAKTPKSSCSRSLQKRQQYDCNKGNNYCGNPQLYDCMTICTSVTPYSVKVCLTGPCSVQFVP